MHRSTFPGKLATALGAAIIATTVNMAGPLEPPPGPVTSTGRFGPRIDVATLSGTGFAKWVIIEPGSYYLSGDLTGESGKSGIGILASDVTLDLNGYSLVGVPGSLQGVDASSFWDIKILNGNIFAWGGDAIRADGSNYQVRNVISRENGAWGMNFLGALNTSVIECTVKENFAGGIRADHFSLVAKTIVAQNHGDGIKLQTRSNVLDTVVTGNYGTGVVCASDCLVRGNIVHSNISGNISAPASTVIENHP